MSRSHLVTMSCVLVSSMALLGHAQTLEKLAEDVAHGKSEFEKKYKAAEEDLRTAFDNRINQARNAPKLSASDRQDAIGAIEAEKAIFEKLGRIPFSPVMRSDAIGGLTARLVASPFRG